MARRGVPHGSRLGTSRWLVERTVALLQIRDDIPEAFTTLSCAIICDRRPTTEIT